MDVLGRLVAKALPRLRPWRLKAHYVETSLLFSPEDDVSHASPALISLALDAIQFARTTSLAELDERWAATEAARAGEPFLRPSCWPGEHYRFLAGLVMALKPRVVVELGTGGGLSALAMLAPLPSGSRIVTFDVVDWKGSRPFNVLRAGDFEDRRLEQHVADLSEGAAFDAHRDLLANADLIFVDGPKDGITEARFLDRLRGLPRRDARRIVVLDDIRLWSLLGLWRSLPYPKLDVTSFGHFSGTGLVEWGAEAGRD